jgi:hypothetical protein
MKERRSSKYTSPKRAIFRVFFSLVCLAGASGSLWFFWTDLNNVLGKSADRSVGILSYKHNTVQRRYDDRLAWGVLPRESFVYNGDLIRTADLSDATVTFVSGDRVDLSENSLVVIRYDEEAGETTTELLSGKINLRSGGGKTVVLAGGKELRSVGGDFEIEGGPDRAKIQAFRGALNDTSGSVRLLAGQAVIAGSEGVVPAAEAVVVLEPLPNQEYVNDEGAVFFRWENVSLSAEDYVRLELAADRNFNETLEVHEYDADIMSANLSLTPGIWWWRILKSTRGNSAANVVIREGRIRVAEPRPERRVVAAAALVSPRSLESLSPQNPLSIPLREAEVPVPEPPPVIAPPPVPPPPPAPIPVPVLAPVPRPALLPRAEGLGPAAGTVIDGDFLKTNRTVVLDWNAVPGANAYFCTIRQGGDSIKQVYEPRLELDPAGSLSNGRCVWRVEAVRLAADGSIEQRGQIAESSFTVAVPRPEAPRIDNPGIIYEH